MTTPTRRSFLLALAGVPMTYGYLDSLGAVGSSLDADLSDLDARVAELEKHKPPPEPEPPATGMKVGLDMRNYSLYVGANAQEPGEATLGPSYIGRTFADPGESGNIIAKGSAASILDAYQARPYRENNRRQMFSMKPNVDKATAGDAQTLNAIQAVAASMLPDDMFTVYHEPENDMSADRWWGMFRNCYDAAKQGNPSLTVVYCAMTYQHGPAGAAYGKSQEWCRDEPCDAFGADDYGPHPYSGKNFNVSLETKKEWRAWYDAAALQAGPGKPRALHVHEFGRSGKDPAAVAARPQVLADSFAWLVAHGFDTFMYWNSSTGQSGTWWPLDDAASQAAWAAILDQARPVGRSPRGTRTPDWESQDADVHFGAQLGGGND